MRISDWSSDVCSSDLALEGLLDLIGFAAVDEAERDGLAACAVEDDEADLLGEILPRGVEAEIEFAREGAQHLHVIRSEERRVGKEGVSTCRSRWSQCPYKKKTQNLNRITLKIK